MRLKNQFTLAAVATVAVSAMVAAGVAASPMAQALPASFIGFSHISTVASTVPANGDVNPYGVVVVGHSQGKLVKGNILVSNFNNRLNQQGTGTTIVSVSPRGAVHLFARISAAHLPGACPGGSASRPRLRS